MIAQLASRHAASFLAAAPGVRIAPLVCDARRSGRGSIWQSLVGHRPANRRDSSGRWWSPRRAVGSIFGAVSQLAAQAAVALNRESAGGVVSPDSARRLYALFQRAGDHARDAGMQSTGASSTPCSWRRSSAVHAGGRPWKPGTRGFWNAVSSDAGNAAGTSRRRKSDPGANPASRRTSVAVRAGVQDRGRAAPTVHDGCSRHAICPTHARDRRGCHRCGSRVGDVSGADDSTRAAR